MRIFEGFQRCVSWKASAASRSFSRTVRFSSSESAPLTNCSVIVEAPWVAPPVTSATSARASERMSIPGSDQKRLSSTATIACCIGLEIWLKVSITSGSGAAKIPIGRPRSSYRYELCPELYWVTFSIWGISEATDISIPNTVETAARMPRPITISSSRSFFMRGLPARRRRRRHRQGTRGLRGRSPSPFSGPSNGSGACG